MNLHWFCNDSGRQRHYSSRCHSNYWRHDSSHAFNWIWFIHQFSKGWGYYQVNNYFGNNSAIHCICCASHHDKLVEQVRRTIQKNIYNNNGCWIWLLNIRYCRLYGINLLPYLIRMHWQTFTYQYLATVQISLMIRNISFYFYESRSVKI